MQICGWRMGDSMPRLSRINHFRKARPAMKQSHTVLRAARLASAIFLLGIVFSSVAHAQTPGLATPNLVLKESVAQMPKSDTQEVRVLTASFKPGDKTVFHSHRWPVTVYVLEGQFSLDLEGRPPAVVSAGQAFVEPPNVKMTGYNRSTTDALRVVIFYVSELGTPFLDPAH
jgi:quercetin dioxygenase-like cupin family protein